MKAKLSFLTICVLICSNLFAQSLDKAERTYVTNYLKESTELIGVLGQTYTIEQLAFKPGENVWSIREITEHLVKTDSLYLVIINRSLKQEAASGEETSKKDADIVRIMTDRIAQSSKLNAPSMIRPQNGFKDFSSAYKALKKSRRQIIKYLKHTKDPLRSHFTSHPLFGQIDLYQWYIMTGAHTERHYQQMLEVADKFQ